MPPQEPSLMPFDVLKMLGSNQLPPEAPPPAPRVSALGALAAASGRANPNVQSVTLSGPAAGSIVWTPDKSHWREKNSPYWRPASEYGTTAKTTTAKTVK